MWSRFQMGSTMPFANRKARMFCTVSLPRKWSIRKTWVSSNAAWTVDPDFVVARMWQSNVEFERGFGDHHSAAVGFSYTRGNDLPVVANINLINPVSALADGRLVYSTAVNAGTRRDPRFNAVFSTQSIADSTYKAMTLQLTRRFYDGIQGNLAYTLSKSEDAAPAHGTTLVVQGDTGGRSNPDDVDFDKGPNILDQRHTFVGSIVAQPQVDSSGATGAILNNNEFGVAIQFASGIPVNVRSNRELNNDAIASDRPIGIERNSLTLPARYNVDLRYSRLIPVSGRVRAEVEPAVQHEARGERRHVRDR